MITRRLYNLALALLLPVGILALGWRLLRRAEYRPYIWQRFGRVDASPKQRVIWLHAVSVGEVISAVPLVKALREQYPAAHLVVSCGTPTGRATATERLAGIVDRVIYLAYDLPPLVASAVRAIRPDLFLVVETEIWPNLLASLAARRVPVLLVNGRISKKSFPRYLRLKGLMGEALGNMTGLLMQSGRDGRRIRRMGAAKDRVHVLGNIKYDQPLADCSDSQLADYAAALGIAPGTPVLLAGSTHEGEETVLAGVWRSLRDSVPNLTLVLAIRHPHRADGVVRQLQQLGIAAGRKSLGDCQGKGVVLLDTVGELAHHYRLADVAFIGGSLVPVGGHNPLEPAALARPVLYGPYVSNFLEPCSALERAGGARRVADVAELTFVLRELYADPHARHGMGAAAQAVFRRNRGAVARTLTHIREVLDGA